MTHKVFWEDPYRTALNATLTRVHGNDVTLDRTIFYAFSGGQESDEGAVGGRRVVEARKESKSIVYTLDSAQGLEEGDAVQVTIEWERRYRLMRLHFAAEIVLELTYRALPGIRKTGAHIAKDKARIDFAWEGNLKELLLKLELEANRLIAANEVILSDFSDEEAERRFWRIAGFAQVPCGGTHIRRTGEVGGVMLKRKNPGRGAERIDIYLAGPDA